MSDRLFGDVPKVISSRETKGAYSSHLAIHRASPKKIAAALGCHTNTINAVATGRHYLLARTRILEVGPIG